MSTATKITQQEIDKVTYRITNITQIKNSGSHVSTSRAFIESRIMTPVPEWYTSNFWLKIVPREMKELGLVSQILRLWLYAQEVLLINHIYEETVYPLQHPTPKLTVCPPRRHGQGREEQSRRPLQFQSLHSRVLGWAAHSGVRGFWEAGLHGGWREQARRASCRADRCSETF